MTFVPDINWEDEELKEAGISKRQLLAVLRLLNDAGERMEKMGLHLYAAAGLANIIHESRPTHIGDGEADEGSSVAVVFKFPCDGGDW